MAPAPADPVPIPLWRPYERRGTLAALVAGAVLVWAARELWLGEELRRAVEGWSAAPAPSSSASD